VVEVFTDRGDVFIRAGSAQGLTVGSEVDVLGEPIADTGEYRTAGAATVLEVWPKLARVSLDENAKSLQAVKYVRVPPQPLRPAQEPAPTPTPTRRERARAAALEQQPEHYGSGFLDPLGFVLLGPTGGVEVGHGHFSGAVYGRVLSAGLLAVGMFQPAGTNFAAFGGGIRGRFYSRPALSGAHVGLGVEYLHSRIEDRDSALASLANFVIPEFELGYRFGFSHFYIGGALWGGYAFQFDSSVEDMAKLGRESQYYVEDESSIYGSVGLELGFYF
jgi:hypothetical protein